MADPSVIDPSYILPGTKIGFYEVIERVGAGGFGALYRVQRDGEIYALKIATYHTDDMTPEDRLRSEERADREVVSLKSLRHPNIVRVHAFEKWPDMNGYPFLVMDFVEGDRLYDWQARTTPSLRRICEVFIKIATALQEMHRIELYHRDLKSENVLVRASDNEPVVVDFGIARPRSAYTITRDKHLLGTFTHFPPEYVRWFGSPEWKRGERFPFRPTTDLHALGYMLYEMLTGRAPFPFLEDEMETMAAITRVVPTPPHEVKRNIPESLSSITMKLLEKDPARRFQTGAELAGAMRDMLDSASQSSDAPHDVVPGQEAGHRVTADERHSSGSKSRPAPVGSGVSIEISPDGEGSTAVAPSPAAAAAGFQPPTAEIRSFEVIPDPIPSAVKRVSRSGERRKSGPISGPAPTTPSAVQPAPVLPLPGSPASAVGSFSPPSMIAADFRPPEDAQASFSAQPEAPQAPTIPTALKNAAAKLGAGHGRPAPNKGLLAVVAGAGLILGALVLMNSGRAPKSESLIAKVKAAEKAEASGTQPPPPPPPATTEPAAGLLPTPPPPAPEPAAMLPQELPSPRPAGGQQDLDAQLRATYGRPAAPSAPSGAHGASGGTGRPAKASPQVVASAEPATPAWLQRGQRLDRPAAAPAAAQAPAPGFGGTAAPAKNYGIPTGTHIRARLLTNLDSRTVASGPVEAQMLRPLVVDGAPALPSRTLLYGQAQASSGGRFTIKFVRMRLPDRTEIPFSGLAMDIEDRKPGLPSSRRIASEASREGTGSKVAKATAGTLLNVAASGTGTPGQLVKGAGDIALQSGSDSASSSSGEALLLDAGLDFDVFIDAAF